MIQIIWVAAGVILGMLISTILIPPSRKVSAVPRPNDTGLYHTDTGCVRIQSIEVPCGQESDSFNLIASLTKK
jgi:hypothetical protein